MPFAWNYKFFHLGWKKEENIVDRTQWWTWVALPPPPPPPFCRPKQSCQSNILFHKEKQDISIPEWTPPLTQGSGSDIQGRRRTGNFLIDFCTQKVHVVYDTLKWRRRNMISKVKTEQFKRSSINRCLFQLI